MDTWGSRAEPVDTSNPETLVSLSLCVSIYFIYTDVYDIYT